MKYYLFLLSLLILQACNTSPERPLYHSTGSQTLDFGDFTIKAPGWRKFVLQGIDSYVGGLTNGKDSLTFDYGIYSADIESRPYSESLYGLDTINGREALIKIPRIPGNGEIAMSIRDAGKGDKLFINGKDIYETQVVLDIFQSIYFRAKHDTINHLLSINQFKTFLPPSKKDYYSGIEIFRQNCASCHHRIKEMTGPALSAELIKTRSIDWLYTFLTDRKHLIKDSAYKARLKQYTSMECTQFPAFRREDIIGLRAYLAEYISPTIY